MTVSTGIIAALFAPLLEAVGFLEWDIHWSKSGGSAFALNLYKCNFSAFLFFCMVVFMNNRPYIGGTIDDNQLFNSPFGNVYGYNKDVNVNVNMGINENGAVLQGGIDLTAGGDHPQLLEPLQELQSSENVEPQPHQFQQLYQQQQQQQQQQTMMQPFPPIQESNWNDGINQQQQQQQQEQQRQQQLLQQNEIQPLQNVQQNQQIPSQELQLQQQQQQEEIPYANERRLTSIAYYNGYQNPLFPPKYHHPFDEHYHQIPYILLSSLLGIIIGDLAELEALRLIGARRILMVYTIKPFAAAFIGNILLNEALYMAAFIGMILTALGVYYVLMGSMEKLEESKMKRKTASLKRSSDDSGGLSFSSSSFHGDDDRSLRSFDTNSTGSDDEIVAIISGGGGGGSTSLSRKSNREVDSFSFQMVGLRRRPLSRHDLTADLESDDIFAEDEANDLMMLLEDGRGVIDTTICCGRVTPPSSGSGSAGSHSGGGSWDNSWADQSYESVNSLNSLEKLDVDVMVAMENFGNDYDDGEDIGMNLGNQRDEVGDKPKMLYEPAATKLKAAETMKRNDSSQEKPLKSALRQSKYGGQSSTSLSKDDNNRLVSGFPMLKKSNNSLPSAIKRQSAIGQQKEEFFKKKDRNKMPRSRSSGSLGSMSSMGSFASFESECGPPPGLYRSDYRESKNERKIRLRTGYVLATLNVTLDAYCSYLTKKYGDGLSTWEINLCRLGFAGLTLTAITFFMRYREYQRKKKERLEQQKRDYQSQSSYFERDSNPNEQRFSGDKESTKIKIRPWYRLPKMSVLSWTVVSVGVFFVTFLSPALANYSLFEIPLALSISLTSITPLFTIPLGILMKGERPTLRGYFGAMLSVIGVSILCIWGVDASSLE